MTDVTTKTHPSGEQVGRKSILICPTCGHESPANGDWEVHEAESTPDHRQVYECPVCEAVVTTRPTFTAVCA